MLGSDIAVTHRPCLRHGSVNYIFASRSEIIGGQNRRHSEPDHIFYLVLDLPCSELFAAEYGISNASVLGKQSEQKMLTAYIGVTHIFRALNGRIECGICFLSKSGKLIHKSHSFPRISLYPDTINNHAVLRARRPHAHSRAVRRREVCPVRHLLLPAACRQSVHLFFQSVFQVFLLPRRDVQET